jgi:hypothetical protein
MVAASMPPNTVVPMDWRLAAPAPLANISGTTPRMKAKAVMSCTKDYRKVSRLENEAVLDRMAARLKIQRFCATLA